MTLQPKIGPEQGNRPHLPLGTADGRLGQDDLPTVAVVSPQRAEIEDASPGEHRDGGAADVQVHLQVRPKTHPDDLKDGQQKLLQGQGLHKGGQAQQQRYTLVARAPLLLTHAWTCDVFSACICYYCSKYWTPVRYMYVCMYKNVFLFYFLFFWGEG